MTLVNKNPGLEEILANSKSPVPDKHKIKVYELLDFLKEHTQGSGLKGLVKKYFCEYTGTEICAGAIIVLNYKDEYKDYVEHTMNRNLFGDKPSLYDGCVPERLYKTTIGKKDDGAILIDQYCNVTNSGVLLEVSPKKLLKELNMHNKKNIAEKYGFAENVGTRHLNSIAASKRMPDATIFTLSASTGRIRIYQDMKIIYSPIPKEIGIRVKETSEGYIIPQIIPKFI